MRNEKCGMRNEEGTVASMLKSFASVAAMGAVLLSVAHAGPVTTVPWNGHTGAASFTYDDARDSQIPNLIPQLDSLGIKATFYIAIQNIGTFNARRSAWLEVARKGHELANHTYRHENVHQISADSVTKVIKQMADTLRGIDPAIASLTFAYPNCNVPSNAQAKAGISAENFIARGCGNTSYAWGTQPSDWMNIQGLIMQPSNQSTGISLLNTAKNQNRWATMIVHDVASPTPDVYSLTPANNLQLLNTAIANGLWVDTYERIGAYYRAHFTMDTAQAVQDGNKKRVEWVSPHPRMPASVPLRVRLDAAVFGDSAVVTQDGKLVPMQADSSYVIDFMKLRMDVHPKGTVVAVRPRAAFHAAPVQARMSGRTLRISGLPDGTYALALRALDGRLVRHGEMLASGGAASGLELEASVRPGVYQVAVRPRDGGTSRHLRVVVAE